MYVCVCAIGQRSTRTWRRDEDDNDDMGADEGRSSMDDSLARLFTIRYASKNKANGWVERANDRMDSGGSSGKRLSPSLYFTGSVLLVLYHHHSVASLQQIEHTYHKLLSFWC